VETFLSLLHRLLLHETDGNRIIVLLDKWLGKQSGNSALRKVATRLVETLSQSAEKEKGFTILFCEL
jgi:hypothetical protein